MCRFMVYKGAEASMADLITRPSHSIVRQSYASLERTTSYVTPPTLNGDGFGVGWYLGADGLGLDPTPGVFTSIQPVWSSENLNQLARKVRSGLVFAHVRAASAPPVSETNCHPFASGRFLFMHKLSEIYGRAENM
jgi:glutamine amidotransferase